MAFVAFFLEGMRQSIDQLHDRVNALTEVLLFRTHLHEQRERKVINDRQYAIVQALLDHGSPLRVADLRSAPWYRAMYHKLTDKTQRRDLQKLKALDLIRSAEGGALRPALAPLSDQDGKAIPELR